jgi:hypothetical protein
VRTASAPPVLTHLAKAAAGDAPLHVAGPTLEGTPFDRAAVEHLVAGMGAELLIVEWQPAVAGGDGLAREMLADPPCDVIVVRPGELAHVHEVVVALGAGPNAPLLARLAQRWAEALGVKASVLHRVETDDDVAEGRKLCRAVAPGLRANVVVGRDLTNLLTETAAATGFVALGATEMVAVDRVAARTGAGQLAQRAAATVVVGRTRRSTNAN